MRTENVSQGNVVASWPRATGEVTQGRGGHVTLGLDMGHLVRDTRTLLMEDEGFKYQLLRKGSYQS